MTRRLLPFPRTLPAFLTALALLALAGCPAEAPEQTGTVPPPPAEVHAAFVLLGESPQDGSALARARVVLEGAAVDCPTLSGGGETVATTARTNPNPESFPVTVCEAVIPFEQAFTVTGTERHLPAARRDPSHIVVFGDTGCKASDCAGAAEPATPFDQLAAAAANGQPDLVLHAGDYDYRGTSGIHTTPPIYDAGDNSPDDPPCAIPTCQLCSAYVSQNASGSEHPDNWTDWKLDLFVPAADLFAAAPWIVTRGNHELCSRAGLGWFYFLDPSAGPEAGGSGQLACPPQDGDGPTIDHILLPEPYTVELEHLRVAVIDSANACDDYAPDETTQHYKRQLAGLLQAVPDGKTTWFFSHRPTWGATNGSDYSPSKTLQTALARAQEELGQESLPEGLKLLVAGHMHHFLSVTFPEEGSEERPPQLVVGNSGVALDTVDDPGPFDATVGGEAALALAFAKHGYLDIPRLEPNGDWKGSVVGAQAGEVYANCDTANLPASSLCGGTADDGSD